MYYLRLDVHKRKISYCLKDSSGQLHAEGSLPVTRYDLDLWHVEVAILYQFEFAIQSASTR